MAGGGRAGDDGGGGQGDQTALYVGYAEFHTARGELDQAEQAYVVALRFGESIVALRGLGSVYLQRGKLKEAQSVIQRAIAIDPEDASAAKLLGELYGKLGRFDQWALQFRRAMELEALARERERKLRAKRSGPAPRSPGSSGPPGLGGGAPGVR